MIVHPGWTFMDFSWIAIAGLLQVASDPKRETSQCVLSLPDGQTESKTFG